MNATFDQSLEGFKRFLEGNGYPQNIIWVTPEDVLLTWSKHVYVRLPVSAKNEREARQLFEDGLSSQSGVLFHAFCEIDGTMCAFAWIPKDRDERLRAMMGTGLKLSVTANSILEGTAVRSSLMWSFLRIKHRKHQQAKDFLFKTQTALTTSKVKKAGS